MGKSLAPLQGGLIQSLQGLETTGKLLREVGKVTPDQAIKSILVIHLNDEDRDKFELRFIKLMQDSEIVLGTSTRGIDIIAMRFLEYWKYEPTVVILKFIDELTKGAFKKVHKNVLDLPTLNGFFAEFKGPYIDALERENRARDKQEQSEVNYEEYKQKMKNYKGEKHEQAKRFSEYLSRYHKEKVLELGTGKSDYRLPGNKNQIHDRCNVPKSTQEPQGPENND